MNHFNHQFQEVYQTHIDQLDSQNWPKDLSISAPLLMNVFESYVRMEKKILFVGQETHGWGRMHDYASVQELQTRYANFDLGKQADYGDGKPFR